MNCLQNTVASAEKCCPSPVGVRQIAIFVVFTASFFSGIFTRFADAQEAAEVAGASVTADSDATQAIRESVELLGAGDFASRERATEHLMSLGTDAIPRLRELEKDPDPEVRMRAADLVRQLADGDFQARVDDFLSGNEVQFEGWEFVQQRLGSAITIRELFIELLQAFPTLGKSLEGTSRDRVLALEGVLATIKQGMYIERRLPRVVDAVAMLLLVSDKDVPITPDFENMLFRVFRYTAGTEIRRDQRLSLAVSKLLGEWVARSLPDNRGEVIPFSLDWGLPEVLPVAISTLEEMRDPERAKNGGGYGMDTLAMAMRAIGRFGKPADAAILAKYLDDERVATDQGFVIGATDQPQLRDVAMASIATIHKMPLSELGFPVGIEHSTFVFSVEDLRFASKDKEARAKARAKVDALLQ